MIADFIPCPSTLKTHFFKVAKITVCDILLTVATLAMNRLACYKILCAILRNSLHYRPSYKETHV